MSKKLFLGNNILWEWQSFQPIVLKIPIHK